MMRPPPLPPASKLYPQTDTPASILNVSLLGWEFRGGRFIDHDLDGAVRLALRGLIQESAA
jgi:hypothetical protein